MESDTESKSLITKAQNGDRDALEQILMPLQKPVFLFLRRFVSESDANDISQETFIQVVKKVTQFRFQSSFRAWVFRIAYRQMLNHQTSTKNRNHKPLQEEEVLVKKATHDSLVEQDEQTEIILKMIDQLPDHQKQVVWFRIREQLTFKEIAEICGESINTILSRMHQAKQVLSQKLKSAGIEMGVTT